MSKYPPSLALDDEVVIGAIDALAQMVEDVKASCQADNLEGALDAMQRVNVHSALGICILGDVQDQRADYDRRMN